VSNRSRGYANVALDVASALLFAAAFPPFGLAALAPVALVPLLVVAARVAPAAAAGHGLLFGLVATLGVAGWLPGTLARFFALSPPAAWLAFGALALAMLALPFALFAAAVSLLARRPPVSPFAIAGLYGGLELLRLLLPVPNPWGLLASTQPSGSALLQLADLAGPCSVGMLLAAANAVVAGFVSPAFASHRRGRMLAVATLACVAVLGYGATRLAADFGSGPPLRVALVSGDGALPGRVDAARLAERAIAGATEAGALDVDLVVWPELALAHPPLEGSPGSDRLLALGATARADWLIGAPHLEQRATPGRPSNSVFLLRRGRVAGRYDKTELMPFAETRLAVGGGRARYEAGTGARSAPLRGSAAQLGVLLCSEALLPARARALVRAGAELLVNPSYDAWLPPAAVEHELRIAALRAIETRRPLLRAATGGRTALVDAHGRIAASPAPGGGDLLVVETRRGLETTVYQRIGDAVPLAGAALACVALLRAIATRRRRSIEFQKENDEWSIETSSLAR